jgi:hypothetical protein
MTAKYIPHFEDPKIKPFQNQQISGQRILVVEDERDLSQNTAEALIDAGFQERYFTVTSAASSK